MSEPDSTIDLDGIDGGGDESWSLLVAGDCYLPADGDGEPFVEPVLAERIAAADVAVANLEAPVSPGDAVPIPKSGPTLAGHPDASDRLAATGFDLATLANNHVMDYGPPGLDATLDACADAGLATVGVGASQSDALQSARFEPVPGVSIALVNVCEREFNVAGPDGPGAAWDDGSETLDAIRADADEHDAVVVIAHGGVEYVPFPAPRRQERLRGFVDAGADLVIGHHPHVTQGYERYGDGAILHSLGNFYFGTQTDGESTRRGLVVEVAFDGGSPRAVELIPTQVADGTVRSVAGTAAGRDHLARLAELSAITADEAALRAHWQVVAVELFYERYSRWLLEPGESAARAGESPVTPADHRRVWADVDRSDLLGLLNVVRMDSHRWVVTEALSVLTGEEVDRRTEDVREAAMELLEWTRR